MKKVAIGCAVLFVLLIAAAAVFLMPMFSAGKDMIQTEMARAAMVQKWVPPEGGLDAKALAPEAVAEFKVLTADTDAEISEFGIDFPGIHATYQSTSGTVQVYVYQASFSEKKTIFQDVDDAPRGGGSAMFTKMPYRCYLWRSDIGQDHVYWANGWLFVFRSVDAEDSEPFVKAYFEATSNAPGEEGTNEAA